MNSAPNRQDISDEMWALLEPKLPGKKGDWGRVANDNRQFLTAVFWVLRTGSPWRYLPSEYGNWNSIAKRFRRWCKNGTWEKVLDELLAEPDYVWLINGRHVKFHNQVVLNWAFSLKGA